LKSEKRRRRRRRRRRSLRKGDLKSKGNPNPSFDNE